MESPLISVIMSVYKEPSSWLQQSVESILNQSYVNFEFIIICDNPDNENGKSLLKEYANNDSRIRLIFNDKNIGLTKSLNKGLKEARGEYIARMDADDISEENRFYIQINYLRTNPDVDFCSTAFSLINEDGVVIKENANGRFNHISYLFRQNPIGHSTVMFKASLLKIRKPFYNEKYRCEQDIELWSFLLLSDVKMEIIPDVLVKYRISRQQISKNKKVDGVYSKKTVRRNLINEYLIKKEVITKGVIGNPYQIINSIESAKLNTSIKEHFIFNILFVLYYTIIYTRGRYFFKYLVSSHRLIFKLPWQDTCRLLACSLGKRESTLLY